MAKYATAFVMLNWLDVILTHRIVSHGGVELNPINAALIGAGWGVFACVKMGLALVFAYAILVWRPRLLVPLCILMGMVVCFNVIGMAL